MITDPPPFLLHPTTYSTDESVNHKNPCFFKCTLFYIIPLILQMGETEAQEVQ